MGRRRAQIDGDDSYQIDAVVSLFAVLLVVLVVLSAVSAIEDGEAPLDYRIEEPDQESFVLKSIRAPYLFRAPWIVSETELLAIDLQAIAEKLETDVSPNVPGFSDGTAKVLFAADADVVGEWRISLIFNSDRPEASFIKERIALSDDDAVTRWASRPGEALIYVWKSGWTHLPRLSDLLRETARPHAFALLQEPRGKIALSRGHRNFAHEKILRAY